MSTILDDLLSFIVDEKTPQSLMVVEERLGHPNLWGAAVKLLGWLKSRARVRKKKPLLLRDDADWCNNIKNMLSMSAELNALFEVKENQLDFRSSISELQRQEAENAVDDGYHPRLMS